MDQWFCVVFMVLMGLSVCVHVHGPLVLGFGGFHSFDGPVHLCVCVHIDHQFWGFGSFHGFDGPVHLCACTWTNGFGFLAIFMILMGLSICVHVHGPTVLGFGSFHGFDGPVHLCAHTCLPIKTMKTAKTQNHWSMYMHTDGQAHQNHENHQNPKPLVHVHAHI